MAARLVVTLSGVVFATSCASRRPIESVVVGVPYELRTLDPHADDMLSSYAVLGSLYEPLVTTDADFRSQPCLATTWTNPDALTWTFRLRPNVRFHSGRPFRARDVVYSLVRLLTTPGMGLRRHLAGVAAVREIDPLAVEIKTNVPAPILLSRLRSVYIVPEGADAVALDRKADGTGPFALEKWTPPESVRLVRNERYWGARPALRHVEYQLGQPAQKAIQGLIDGRYRLVQANSPNLEVPVDRFTVQRRESLFIKYLAFDLSRDTTPYSSVRPNPFKDLRVRQAIHLAIDRRKLIASVSGSGFPASQVVSDFVFGFNPGIAEGLPNAETARDLLRKAGLTKGFAATLHTRRILAQSASFIKASLVRVGIILDLRIVPDAEFVEILNRRDASFWLNRYGSLTGDAGEALADLFHSKDEERYLGIDNDFGLTLPDLDQAIEKSAAMEMASARRAAIQAVLERVAKELLVVPLYSDADTYAMDRELVWAPRADSYIRGQDIGLRSR